MTVQISLARTDEEIAACLPVMRQLRIHLVDTDFVQRIRLQQRTGYQLCYLAEGGAVRSVAGFRLIENLASGRVLYVDDLVTDSDGRSKGFGQKLLDWLLREAESTGCDTLELDSGVQRFDAHRFYLRNRMHIASHHFRIVLAS
ncbi:MAG TPA: GNAT family N-acetyltransferase [Candidatus Binataceae bacterium]|nr:GNAT family N-acetyltransferase [Candidatus Binataceae bacterium]